MSYMDKHLNNLYGRMQKLEGHMSSIFKVLEEIIGKELLRGQALHKVLMDKNLFTDVELKAALEKLIEESKADMKAMEEKAKEEKQKAVEILVPAGANLKPPVDTGTPPAPLGPGDATTPPTEGTDAQPTTPA